MLYLDSLPPEEAARLKALGREEIQGLGEEEVEKLTPGQMRSDVLQWANQLPDAFATGANRDDVFYLSHLKRESI